jgi:hypothetical protein
VPCASELLTCARTHVPSERSGLPIIVIIGAINSRDVAIVTGNSAAPVLAKDSTSRAAHTYVDALTSIWPWCGRIATLLERGASTVDEPSESPQIGRLEKQSPVDHQIAIAGIVRIHHTRRRLDRPESLLVQRPVPDMKHRAWHELV